MPDGKRVAQSGITDIATIIVNFTNEEPLYGLMLLPMMGINPRPCQASMGTYKPVSRANGRVPEQR